MLHPHYLINSPKLHLLIPYQWGLRFHQTNLGKTQTFIKCTHCHFAEGMAFTWNLATLIWLFHFDLPQHNRWGAVIYKEACWSFQNHGASNPQERLQRLHRAVPPFPFLSLHGSWTTSRHLRGCTALLWLQPPGNNGLQHYLENPHTDF